MNSVVCSTDLEVLIQSVIVHLALSHRTGGMLDISSHHPMAVKLHLRIVQKQVFEPLRAHNTQRLP